MMHLYYDWSCGWFPTVSTFILFRYSPAAFENIFILNIFLIIFELPIK